jgi:IPT/TIG domain
MQKLTPAGNGTFVEWNMPSLPEGEAISTPTFFVGHRLLLNADEVLAPQVTSVAPASGGTQGGNQVVISGKYLDGATAVMFGATPAPSFTVDFPNQISAVAPASAPARSTCAWSALAARAK